MFINALRVKCVQNEQPTWVVEPTSKKSNQTQERTKIYKQVHAVRAAQLDIISEPGHICHMHKHLPLHQASFSRSVSSRIFRRRSSERRISSARRSHSACDETLQHIIVKYIFYFRWKSISAVQAPQTRGERNLCKYKEKSKFWKIRFAQSMYTAALRCTCIHYPARRVSLHASTHLRSLVYWCCLYTTCTHRQTMLIYTCPLKSLRVGSLTMEMKERKSDHGAAGLEPMTSITQTRYHSAKGTCDYPLVISLFLFCI